MEEKTPSDTDAGGVYNRTRKIEKIHW